MSRTSIGKVLSSSMVFALAAATACSLVSPGNPASPTAMPAAPNQAPAGQGGSQPAGTHASLPGDPPASYASQISDFNSSAEAVQQGVGGGDSFSFDLFERPFGAGMKTYLPYLDIRSAGLGRDDTWFYVTIRLAGADSNGSLPGVYGLEIDTNLDGRGDYLIAAAAPGKDWSDNGVRAWQDANHDVGSVTPLRSDAPKAGDGYETVLFDAGKGSDPDAAFARLSPKDPNSVQIAFKRSLIGDNGHFLWGAWAFIPDMFHPDWFDYNDHFTLAQAGSPLKSQADYFPLKELYGVDGTCRWAFGFKPTGGEPGVCPVPATATPTRSPANPPGPTATPTQIIIP